MATLLVVIGVVFAPLAAAMAYLITYEEWSRHQLPRGQVVRRSLHGAAVALGFFLLLTLGLGLVLPMLLGSR
jgi:hypothetical protein